MSKHRNLEAKSGKVGWALLWLMGIQKGFPSALFTLEVRTGAGAPAR